MLFAAVAPLLAAMLFDAVTVLLGAATVLLGAATVRECLWLLQSWMGTEGTNSEHTGIRPPESPCCGF